MARRILIIGSNGQLGSELEREFTRRGWDTLALSRGQLDITSQGHVDETLSDVKAEVVVNAAAYNRVDEAEREPEAAFRVNGFAVRNLAQSATRTGARLVHFSTDYVFDGGKQAPYEESDLPAPLSTYGVSKLAGEYLAFAYQPESIVIRTCGVFGPAGSRNGHGNFVETMLRLAGQGRQIRVVADRIASPTYAPTLASRSADLVEAGATGLFHAGGGEAVSWYHYAERIFAIAGFEVDLRTATSVEMPSPARRPSYSALSNARMESLGVDPFPPLEEQIAEYMQFREVAVAPAS